MVLRETIKAIHGAQILSVPLEEATGAAIERTHLVLREIIKAIHGAQILSAPLEEATAAHVGPTLSGL